MALLADLVVSYLFEKSKTLLNQKTYHVIYQYEGLVVFKGNKSIQEINNWLSEFQKTLDKSTGI